MVLIWALCLYITSYCNDRNTYFVFSDACKKVPSDKYIGIQSLEDALAVIKQHKDSRAIKFVLADGYHHLKKTLEFDNIPQKVTIEALNQGKAVITGNIRIKKENIQQKSNRIVSFPLERECYLMNVNGRYVTMSSSASKDNPYGMKQFSDFRKEKATNTYSAVFEKDEIKKMEIGAYIFIYCKWIMYKLKIQSIDSKNKRVTMSGMAVNVSYINNDKKVYYSIHNSRKVLAPSTYAWIQNKMYYALNKNENIQNVQIQIPVLSKLISIRNGQNGISIKGVLVEGATMDNLLFEEAQGGANFSAAIDIQNSQNVTIENCEFTTNLGYAIKISNNSAYCTLKNNYLHDTQGGGFMVGDYKLKDNTNHITIHNNLIKSFGRMNATSEGILVTKANQVTITNNTICDGYYTGISLGWTWGYGKTYSYGNYVANNHIHHLMQCVLSDGAGIYTLGNQKETIIENNYIHDVVSRVFNAAGSSLLYFDEGTSNTVARNNVCFGSHTGFHEHYGKVNLVVNNVFAYTNLVSMRLSNIQKDSLLTLKDNILMVDCGTAYNENLFTKKSKLINNRTENKKLINQTTGLKKATKPINIKMDLNELYDKKLIKNKFAYGVTSKELKNKAVLSADFWNKHNEMISDNFSPCSSYFKKKY